MGQTKLSVQEIAGKLAELLNSGAFATVQNTLFAQDVLSIDLPDANGKTTQYTGVDAILKRTEQFQAAVASVERLRVSAPIVQGNAIAVEFELDFTLKQGGPQQLAEIIVYMVKDGKIVHEQFFA